MKRTETLDFYGRQRQRLGGVGVLLQTEGYGLTSAAEDQLMQRAVGSVAIDIVPSLEYIAAMLRHSGLDTTPHDDEMVVRSVLERERGDRHFSLCVEVATHLPLPENEVWDVLRGGTERLHFLPAEAAALAASEAA